VSQLFPKWTNSLATVMAVGGFATTVLAVGVVWNYFTPEYWEVGYMPEQPASGFSHQIHAGKLGMDCRYCHSNVEKSSEANVPSVSVCYGCHAEAHVSYEYAREDATQYIRDAWTDDASIAWDRIHKLPDYVRNFPHHIHVNAGVSCYSCHGQITAMPVVYQEHSLSMSWCLDCHRAVAKGGDEALKYIVPPDKVTRLTWVEEHLTDAHRNSPLPEVQQIIDDVRDGRVQPPENCGACHY